ncbi:MAG: hypothetical protein GIW95_08560 [Candidatus Eremiobacteraeota bacterium]|nr:hypothetical protein [Candidatus Eremiobacteraeota bacterium]
MLVVLGLAAVSVSAATYRFMRLQKSIDVLLFFEKLPPAELAAIVLAEARERGVDIRLRYIDTAHRFCFATVFGPSVFISAGFVERLDSQELSVVAMHEAIHISRRDPWRSIAWHLLFAGLVLPGFGAIETALHLRRERIVDSLVIEQTRDRGCYLELLRRCSRRRDSAHGAICTSNAGMSGRAQILDQDAPVHLWKRSLPALVSIATLLLVFASHSVFMTNLPYLESHHC